MKEFNQPSIKIGKYITALHHKKFRKEFGAFLVEGEKVVLELLASNSIQIKLLIATDSFLHSNSQLINQTSGFEVYGTNPDWLAKNGTLTTNNTALAVARIPETEIPLFPEGKWAIALDSVSDPGNLGTIIRIADWYGIRKVFCSPDCADWYSPKVINASKGSFLRVFSEIIPLIDLKDKGLPLFVADMEGEDVHTFSFEKYPSGILILGSESHGVSREITEAATHKISIPNYGRTAESLNVAVATAILCDNLFRKIIN